MLQRVIATWNIRTADTSTSCAVLALLDGYRVIVSVNRETLTNELHPTCESAIRRADDLRAFFLAGGCEEAVSHAMTMR